MKESLTVGGIAIAPSRRDNKRQEQTAMTQARTSTTKQATTNNEALPF
jgi:hypothetical protein